MRMTRRSFTNRPFSGLLLAVSLTGILATVFGAGTAEARIWKDASGKHTIDADFVELTDGVVKLRRPNGKVQSIPLKKLSKADRQHITTLVQPKKEAAPAPVVEKDSETVRLQLVVAEGVGRKKDEAINNAIRNAVRHALGVLVASKDLIEHNDKIEELLSSDNAGFVNKHEKLGERRVAGSYLIKIKAQVLQSDLLAELKTAGIPVLPLEIQHQFSTVTKIDLGDSAALDDELKANAWAIRTASHRARAVKRNGGSRKSEKAVRAGLEWLARHQNRNGSWSFNYTPGEKCSGFPNPGTKASKMGATGLVLLAFLGDGHTHKDKSDFQKTVRAGLGYLVSNMDKSGRLFESNGPGATRMYCHGISACAIVEAYGMTQDKKLRKAAQASISYIVKTQGSDGGWRYAPNTPGDTSVVGWQVMALKSAKMANLDVPKKMYPSVMKFLDAVQKPKGSRVYYTYMPGREIGDPAGTTAIGLLCRTYMGWPKDRAELKSGVPYVSGKGPQAKNMYFNYYATMFLFQNDGPNGPAWTRWNATMQNQLVGSQATDSEPHLQGSWSIPGDNSHHEGEAGGRLYHTAMATMTLEVYYRYGQFFDQ